MKRLSVVLVLMLLIGLCIKASGQDPFPNRRQTQTGQSAMGVHVLYGDLQVEETGRSSSKPLMFEVVLFNRGGTPVSRQPVAPGGRYRFQNLQDGQYELAVMLEGEEVARMRAENDAATVIAAGITVHEAVKAAEELEGDVQAEADRVAAEVRSTVENMPDPPLSDLVDHVYADPPATLRAQWRRLEEFEAQFAPEA